MILENYYLFMTVRKGFVIYSVDHSQCFNFSTLTHNGAIETTFLKILFKKYYRIVKNAPYLG